MTEIANELQRRVSGLAAGGSGSDAGQPMEAHPGPAAVAGHPVHPMLIPFPIAFLSGAAMSDVLYLRTHHPFWASASEFLLGAGIGTGAIAAPFGLLDFATVPAARKSAGWIHMAGNLGVVTLSAANLAMRRLSGRAAVPVAGAALSFVALAGLMVTGWMGGELVYRIGVGSRPSAESDAGSGEWRSGTAAVPVMSDQAGTGTAPIASRDGAPSAATDTALSPDTEALVRGGGRAGE